jgi:predicted Rossmann fold flavoprotein
MKKVIIIGGGAAGFFTAINLKEQLPTLEVTLLEKGKEVLQKVKISGGGRCNVTHACFDPKELVTFYPRGQKELLGPFHKFMTGDTFEWFESKGVPLKIEGDNRVFPEANSSQAIIDCFQKCVRDLQITVHKNQGVLTVEQLENQWQVQTKTTTYQADFVVMAAGSSKKIWDLCHDQLNHRIVPPVPSLFTFNIKDQRLVDLGGISVPHASVKILGTKLENEGPLLITHWGLSGPAILKLSAFGARILADKNYQYQVEINWLGLPTEHIEEQLINLKHTEAKKLISLRSPFSEIPRRLWERLVTAAGIRSNQKWADLSNKQLQQLSTALTKSTFNANGRTTFKEEFVTAGGVDLKEIDFKHFQSRIHSNLYFVGEVLNIDAVTGGFNFQNAWTGGFICAQSIAQKCLSQ